MHPVAVHFLAKALSVSRYVRYGVGYFVFLFKLLAPFFFPPKMKGDILPAILV